MDQDQITEYCSDIEKITGQLIVYVDELLEATTIPRESDLLGKIMDHVLKVRQCNDNITTWSRTFHSGTELQDESTGNVLQFSVTGNQNDRWLQSEDNTIQKAIEIIKSNFGKSKFSVQELSDKLGLSRICLYKKMKQKTGLTPVELIRMIRINKAADLLVDGNLRISEVAYQVGFNDTRYFSRYFNVYLKMLPSQYVRKYKKSAGK